ncbi:SigE-dependent sporulation protein [Bacillus canaveralius]|uniref:SigE-dependent sporulation protein n=1 Tax=Bacillus canaveralius TaxID=1403243 RepID=A0A2N5GNE4_9BACI|nr:SigE-dependent sporulation protein [Bacillus canaveralius]PLR86709.1 SigE-dependent sporulation protein [Bacillus sp. V33-4]PLR96462.1 SigE-dependent sporulation protein [Bacillus canaveralius]RSK44905.1 SigE-dependent sporulation protein [Bacillus canaveralius]
MIPVWIYFVVAGIVVSAYMAVKAGKEERREQNEDIEREGEIYMERLEKAKEERKANEKSFGI